MELYSSLFCMLDLPNNSIRWVRNPTVSQPSDVPESQSVSEMMLGLLAGMVASRGDPPVSITAAY